MVASVVRDETGYPTCAAIEAELDLIWPGWSMVTTTHGPEPRHEGELGRLDSLDPARCRRLKWLLKVHKMRSVGALVPGMGVAANTPAAANVPGVVVAEVRVGNPPQTVYRVHVIPGRGYRAEDEPPSVRSARTAADIALRLRLPLPLVRTRLASCPSDADPIAWVAGGAR